MTRLGIDCPHRSAKLQLQPVERADIEFTGQLQLRRKRNTLSDPSGKQYSWDFEKQADTGIVPNVGTTTFRYDPFGRRIYKQSTEFHEQLRLRRPKSDPDDEQFRGRGREFTPKACTSMSRWQSFAPA